MTDARAAIVAAVILLIAGAGSVAAAPQSGRAPRDTDSSAEECSQAKHEHRQLLDIQKHRTLTRAEKKQIADIDDRIKLFCDN